MGQVLGILVVLIGLTLSVALHELGHMLPAKRFGALVPEYAIGFGPKLFSVKKGTTHYVLRALPLGGYVRLLGMFAPGSPSRKRWRRSGHLTLAEEARRASAEEIPKGEEARAFYRLSWWRKVIVMACGPMVNLLLAFVFLAVAAFGIGSPVATLELSEVRATVHTSSGELPGPAATAGVKPGDRIVAVEGRPISRWSELGPAVKEAGHGPIELTLERADALVSVPVTPLMGEDERPVIGVVAAKEYRAATPSEFIGAYIQMLTRTGDALISLPSALWNVAHSLVAGTQRDQDGLVSIVGVGRIAGEVSADSSGANPDSLRYTWSVLLSILASVNIALGLFNLIPLLPLDGGHIAAALFEGARTGFARLARKPHPRPVDTARLMPLSYTVGALLLAMTLLLVLADIIRPIALE
ncbi:M50 family metallopeptidase [Schaalia cardiffensis]|uniref:M50 family metallopeptidase n=1 Tax=Schaalia cardiffensis TaxID=181487 RepID=UPI002AB29B44|nr:M50 family metallopeptidase [Schaalia cardiffensis]